METQKKIGAPYSDHGNKGNNHTKAKSSVFAEFRHKLKERFAKLTTRGSQVHQHFTAANDQGGVMLAAETIHRPPRTIGFPAHHM